MSALAATVARLAGAPVQALRPLRGGDLSEVYLCSLAGGRRLAVKTGPLVAAEARMLRKIRTAGCPAPEVIAAEGQVLLMQALEETPATAAAWQALGTALARLHSRTGPQYGWDEDYAFGPVRIPNQPLADWPQFWAQRRLLAAPEALPSDLRQRAEALAARLGEILPARPPASLLHGDLWTGNVLFSDPAAYFIDPACCYGDGEADLAMLHLFGTPPAEFEAAYGPLAPGHAGRRAVYQLWPALVHLRLFGAGYRSMVERLLEKTGF